MINENATPQQIEEVRLQMEQCRAFLLDDEKVSYSLPQLTSMIVTFLNAHLYYYSNNPQEYKKDKKRRIETVLGIIRKECFFRTREFLKKLTGESRTQQKILIQKEIMYNEYPFIFDGVGQYSNYSKIKDKTTFVFISNFIRSFNVDASPYFESIYDDDFDYIKDFGEGFFKMLMDAYYLHWLRNIMKEIDDDMQKPNNKTKDVLIGKIQPVTTFEEMFHDANDALKCVETLKKLIIIGENNLFINVRNNKTRFTSVVALIRIRGKIKQVSASLMCQILKQKFSFSMNERLLTGDRKRDAKFEKQFDEYWNASI
jgi:hypothetical protein